MRASKIERIIKGEETAGLLFLPFLISSYIYGLIVRVRNKLFDIGVISSEKADCPVISVGNITLGGTGKTPFSMLLAERTKDLGGKIAILSRGYPLKLPDDYLAISDFSSILIDSRKAPDEPYLMAKSLTGVAVACARKRINGARKLVNEMGANLIILDDGFQHRAIHRDLDFVLVEASNPFGANNKLLPLGVLREPPSSLARADAIVVTSHTDLNKDYLNNLKTSIHGYAGAKPVIAVKGSITGFATLDGEPVKLPDEPVVAFCGVANPVRFKKSLQDLGLSLEKFIEFPDHHNFTSKDIFAISQEALKRGVKFIITTEKDVVRLEGRKEMFGESVSLLQALYRHEVIEGSDELSNLLARIKQD